MPKLKYAPKALEDLQKIKRYVTDQFGEERAKVCLRDILSTIKQLEMFHDEGLDLGNTIEYPTDCRYLVVKPDYVFYRMENEIVKIVRVLNEKQDFMQILLGSAAFQKRENNTGMEMKDFNFSISADPAILHMSISHYIS